MASLFEKVKDWFTEVADWIQENLGDPAIAAALRDDLGLAPGEDVPKAQRDRIQQFADGFDPDKTGFAETVAEVSEIAQAVLQLADQIKGDEATGPDLAFLIGRLAATESLRLRAPLLYWLGKLTLFITDDLERLAELDPKTLVNAARGDADALGSGEGLLLRVTASLSLLYLLEEPLTDLLGHDFLDVFYGWEPAPGTPTPDADRVASQATTFVFRGGDAVAGELVMTLLGVPREHSGPGLFLSLGGGIDTEQTVGDVKYEFDSGLAEAFDMFIPLGDEAADFAFTGDPRSYVRLAVTRAGGGPGDPALRIGDAGKTRLDIGALGLGIDLLPEAAAFRLFARQATLVVELGEGDGFLSSISGGNLSLHFDLGITADTNGGVRVDGGTLLRSTLPVNESLGGFLDVHHVEFLLGPGSSGDPGYDLSLELSTAFGVQLGPFQASVDRIGFRFEAAFREGNLGFLDVAVGFKPPSGVGLSLDAGIVKGGGYLFFDPARGEYAGALELKFASWGLKAVGILSTQMPDGSHGFALLLLIYADLPRFHIAFGIFFEGVGGVLGLQHGVDIQAIQDGIPTGLFDDILFPANPVADAPRIINRLRVVFPVRRGAFLIGPMFRLTWGTPAVGDIKLGVLLAADNVLGGDGPVSLSSILLLGQLRVGLPTADSDQVARVICDFFGYLDFSNKRFGFYARLRNSKLVGSLELAGSLVLQVDFGTHPSFVLAVGGFHPAFRDLPVGLPAKLDRVAIRFNIGIVKVSIDCYLAVTSATVQFGAELRVAAKIGPVGIDGWIGFDALIYYEPRFSFTIDFRAGLAVKFKGYTLASVDVRGQLSGPGLWHITGRFTFSILFWDVSKSFDEQWGEVPALPTAGTDVAALLRAAYANEDNWSAALPAGTDTLVTLSAVKGEAAVLAHPLGQLRVTQKVAPLGLTLEKYGETRVEGPKRFDLQAVTVGGVTASGVETTREHLARASYVRVSEEDRLSKPQFESFDVGVVVGSSDFVTPTAEDGDLSYETKILGPSPIPFLWDLTHVALAAHQLPIATVATQAKQGAAAGSALRRFERLRSDRVARVTVREPTLVAVDYTDLAPAIALDGHAARNLTLAEQQVAALGGDAQLVELFELVKGD